MGFTLEDVRSRTYKARDAWWTVFLVDPLAGRAVVRIANRTSITPNQLTWGALVLGLGSAGCFLMQTWAWLIAGAVLYHLSFVLDCMDGKIARLKGTGTVLGGWLDYVFDRVRVLACTITLMMGQYEATGHEFYLLMGVGVYLLLRRDSIGGIWLLLLGWFLAQAARGAVVSSRFSERLEGVTVADVMDTQPVTVPGELSVGDAQDEFFLRYRFPWFPVVDGFGRFLGILREESIEGAVNDGRPTMTVGEVLGGRPDENSFVPRETPIEQLLGSETLRGMGALMVVDSEQRLCGVVTIEQVRRALAGAVRDPVTET